MKNATARRALVAAAIKLKAAGKPLSEIARTLDSSASTICRLLKKYPSADLPLEYFADGFKEPLPPAVLAKKELVNADIALLKARENLRAAASRFKACRDWQQRAQENFSRLAKL